MKRNVSADSSQSKKEEEQMETTKMNQTHRGRTKTRVLQLLLSGEFISVPATVVVKVVGNKFTTEKKLISRVEPFTEPINLHTSWNTSNHILVIAY